MPIKNRQMGRFHRKIYYMRVFNIINRYLSSSDSNPKNYDTKRIQFFVIIYIKIIPICIFNFNLKYREVLLKHNKLIKI